MTYIAIVRHPLDVALSDLDHAANMDAEEAIRLRVAASGKPENVAQRTERPDEIATYLRWFIDNDEPPTGSGPNGLADYCQQIRTYWEARERPNVHLFHYSDLWVDRDIEMRRVAAALNVTIEEALWSSYVAAASLESMRERASETAPEAHLSLWRSNRDFFRSGGRRAWADYLTAHEIAHFHRRMDALAGDAADWALEGRHT